MTQPFLSRQKTACFKFSAFYGLWGCMVILAWIGYFRHLGGFGLYGDDVAFIGSAINRPWSEEWKWITFCLTSWPQGRPLGMGINLSLLPYIIAKCGGMLSLHIVSCGLLATNGFLLARLTFRFLSLSGAFCVGAFYVLAPAAVVQPQLVFAYNTQISVLCALLSAFAAMRNRWVWYGVGVIVTTLMGEPASVAALLLPFSLLLAWRNRQWMLSLRALLLWTGSVGTILVLRVRIGDPWGQERVGEMLGNPGDVFRRAVGAALNGSSTQFELLWERLLTPWHDPSAETAAVFLAVTLLAFAALRVIRWLSSRKAPPMGNAISEISPEIGKNSWRVLLAGLLVMAGAYASFFRDPWYPATWSTGFMSGLHCVPSVGGALCIGFLLDRLQAAVKWHRAQLLSQILIGTLIGSLAAFGTIVQRDYLLAWRFQKEFWQAFDKLCSDAGESTFVLVLDRMLPTFPYADRSSWTSEIMPASLYDFSGSAPEGSAYALVPVKTPPSVIFSAPNLTDIVRSDHDRFQWKPTYYFMLPKSSDQQPQDGNVIVLERQPSGWTRWQGAVAVDGGMLRLKPAQSVARRPLLPLAQYYGLLRYGANR